MSTRATHLGKQVSERDSLSKGRLLLDTLKGKRPMLYAWEVDRGSNQS